MKQQYYIYIVLHANAKTAFDTNKTTITTTIFWIKKENKQLQMKIKNKKTY